MRVIDSVCDCDSENVYACEGVMDGVTNCDGDFVDEWLNVGVSEGVTVSVVDSDAVCEADDDCDALTLGLILCEGETERVPLCDSV